MSELSLLTLVGLGLLLAALGAALKIGFWVWLASRLTRRGREEQRVAATQFPTHAHAAAAAAPPATRNSGLDTTKKIVTIVAAILGIVSTTVGLVKDCSDEPESSAPAYPSAEPRPGVEPRPVYQSTTCCAVGVSCVILNGPQPLGSVCVCIDALGNTVPGRVC